MGQSQVGTAYLKGLRVGSFFISVSQLNSGSWFTPHHLSKTGGWSSDLDPSTLDVCASTTSSVLTVEYMSCDHTVWECFWMFLLQNLGLYNLTCSPGSGHHYLVISQVMSTTITWASPSFLSGERKPGNIPVLFCAAFWMQWERARARRLCDVCVAPVGGYVRGCPAALSVLLVV